MRRKPSGYDVQKNSQQIPKQAPQQSMTAVSSDMASFQGTVVTASDADTF